MLLFELTPKQEKAKRTRLWKCYRWTLEMYNALGELQEWKCAGCGREAKTMPLNVDHFHFKIIARRDKEAEWTIGPHYKWYASTLVEGQSIEEWGRTKIEAMAKVRERALPLSVRGLLCAGRYAGCNRKLGRIDQIPWLENMLKYLKDPPAQRLRMQRAFSASPQEMGQAAVRWMKGDKK